MNLTLEELKKELSPEKSRCYFDRAEQREQIDALSARSLDAERRFLDYGHAAGCHTYSEWKTSDRLTRIHASIAESSIAIFSRVAKERWENASRRFAVCPRGPRCIPLFLSIGDSEPRGIHARGKRRYADYSG